MTFHPQARKVKSQFSGLEFWLSPVEHPSYEGLPVYTHTEIALLKKHKDKVTPDFFKKIYEMKLAFNVTIADLVDMLEPKEVENPYESKGKLGPQAQLSLQIIYSTLRGAGAGVGRVPDNEKHDSPAEIKNDPGVAREAEK